MSSARISVDPSVMMGKPCIKGTRITVELVLRKLGAGRSVAEIQDAYPQISNEDVLAVLTFAADYMQHETVIAAESMDTSSSSSWAACAFGPFGHEPKSRKPTATGDAAPPSSTFPVTISVHVG